jgi:hypothetical protein
MAVESRNLAERKIYPPANECIYCGAKGVPLTDEHTIPEGMGGRHILPKASCKACQKIINEEFEQYCQRTLFSNLRVAHGLKSARKRKPLRYSVQVLTHEDKIDRIYMKAADLPRVFMLPVFPNPFFLSGQKLVDGDAFEGAWWHYSAEAMPALLAKLGVKSILSEKVYPAKFARFLAKIAHAHAWAVYGPVFEPMLPPVILGKYRDWIDLVGGMLHPVEATGEDGLKLFRSPRDDGDYLVSRIRFFPRLASPVYYAVIGKLTAPWPLQEREP